MIKVDLSGKVPIVTGGTGGIGSVVAEAFALNGATVYLTGRNVEKGNAIVADITEKGGKAHFVKADVSSEEETKALVDRVAAEQGRIDILVNNAGGNIPLERRGKIYKYYEDAWHETIDKCMDGDYFYTKHAFPYLAKNGGRIITVGSVTGFRMGLRNQSAYNMAKAAIHNYTRCSASEMAPYGITVNCFIPGTTWHANFAEKMLKEPGAKERFLSHVPVGQPNTPWDMANAALFFASEEGARVTGVLLPVDGGWSAGYCREEGM